MIRRRCRDLTNEGLLKVVPRNPGRGRGRPEWVYSLKPAGVGELTGAKVLREGVPIDHVTGDNVERECEHQILVNWMMVWSKAIEQQDAALSVRFISSKSPYHLAPSGGSILFDQVEFPSGECLSFTPDAAICLTHKGMNKRLLFFIEVDLGTETIADPKRINDTDLRHKICVYRAYLGRGGYKRSQDRTLFQGQFRGFRLLLVSSTVQRCTALCQLVRQLPPSDFVWVTDYNAVENHGMGHPVWFAGGQTQDKHSILGRKSS